MNVAKLRAVMNHIAEHPEEFEMTEWCGSVGCIAGHTLALDRQLHMGADTLDIVMLGGMAIMREAAEVLGLNFDQARRLFFAEGWPEPFRSSYDSVFDAVKPMAADALLGAAATGYLDARAFRHRFLEITRAARAEVALARLEFFIQTGGTDIESTPLVAAPTTDAVLVEA